MATCPHCREASIGVHRKWWSSPSHPVKCTRCGGLSYNSKTHESALSRAVGLVPVVVVIAILITGSLGALWVGALVVVGAVAYEAVAFYRAPMVVASEVAVSEARHYERLGLAILGVMAMALIAYWLLRRAA